MFGALTGEVAATLTQRWGAAIGLSCLFWSGGVLAWVSANSSRPLSGALEGLGDVGEIAVGLAIAATVLGSAAAVDVLVRPALRFLEGYWRSWTLLWHLRQCLVRRESRISVKDTKRLKALLDKQEPLDEQEQAEKGMLEVRVRQWPATGLMPTRIGNILRAGERWPMEKYGLDAIVCWPRLWLIVPDGARSVLSDARRSLDLSVAAFIWSAFFIFWTFCAWWPLLIAPIAAFLSLFRICAAARSFAALVEAAFDVYRMDLYCALRLPIPASPRSEKELGRLVTELLARGIDDDRVQYDQRDAPAEQKQ